MCRKVTCMVMGTAFLEGFGSWMSRCQFCQCHCSCVYFQRVTHVTAKNAFDLALRKMDRNSDSIVSVFYEEQSWKLQYGGLIDCCFRISHAQCHRTFSLKISPQAMRILLLLLMLLLSLEITLSYQSLKLVQTEVHNAITKDVDGL